MRSNWRSGSSQFVLSTSPCRYTRVLATSYMANLHGCILKIADLQGHNAVWIECMGHVWDNFTPVRIQTFTAHTWVWGLAAALKTLVNWKEHQIRAHVVECKLFVLLRGKSRTKSFYGLSDFYRDLCVCVCIMLFVVILVFKFIPQIKCHPTFKLSIEGPPKVDHLNSGRHKRGTNTGQDSAPGTGVCGSPDTLLLQTSSNISTNAVQGSAMTMVLVTHIMPHIQYYYYSVTAVWNTAVSNISNGHNIMNIVRVIWGILSPKQLQMEHYHSLKYLSCISII